MKWTIISISEDRNQFLERRNEYKDELGQIGWLGEPRWDAEVKKLKLYVLYLVFK